MPSLLAIECSTDACSVALGVGSKIEERHVIQPREHHQILLPMVMELLRANHHSLKQLDVIAYGAGPGSFTGLRLCAGVVQGLAFALQKPVIPVSSLAAMALSFAQQHGVCGQTILVALDARMGDVYGGAYYRDDNGLKPLADDRLLSRPELEQLADSYPGALQIGNGWQHPSECLPHAAAVLALAKPVFEAGKMLTAMETMPVYLRETVSWQKWQPKASRQPV